MCCCLTFPPSDILRAFRPSLHPMYADHTSLFNPCSLLAVVSVRATSQLGVFDRCVICGFFFFFPLPVMLPSEIPKLLTALPGRGFPGISKFLLLHDSLPRMCLCPNSFVSFYILYFALPLFKENGLTFWVPVVLHQRSEVVLWNLLSVQMIFQ